MKKLIITDKADLYAQVESLQFSQIPNNIFSLLAQKYIGTLASIYKNNASLKYLYASLHLQERLTRHYYQKPSFNITNIEIANQNIMISEEVVINDPFCNLLHFKKSHDLKQQKLLIAAPMSGHYATLCKNTIESLLPFFDVYLTDWKNARDVPLSLGKFNLDDYINYCIKYISHLGSDATVMAVCQPAVPVLAATALMAANNDKNTPKNVILIGGPIDTRKSPTKVNSFANQNNISWFEENVITEVPVNYPGFKRKVYPGFIQLAGFISMNFFKHYKEHRKNFQAIIQNDHEFTTKHENFYDEYFSTMDLTAEFYLQTINVVFKEHLLPRKEWYSHGKFIDLDKITNTRLLAIEGELDDITGSGQTKAAINLCSNIKAKDKNYIYQKNAGHYGLFSGSKFKNYIIPQIIDFCL